jgi:ubiquinone/menaquinone biosynthesis C-methylase UbiE
VGFYGERVLPRIFDVMLGRPMAGSRARVTTGLSGEVLELGFGSGTNLPHLPAGVTRLLAVEPSRGGRRLAEHRIEAAPFPVEFIGEDGAYLPLPEGSVDHVLVTFALCTIPEVDRALAEVRRVLKPGGTLRFAEHGRSPNPRVARRQEQLSPLWGKMFGGCHLDRPIDELIEKAGLTLGEVRRGRFIRPETVGFLYEGVASKQEV